MKKKMKENNIEIILNENVKDLVANNKNITSVITTNKKIYGKNFILCLPPKSIYDMDATLINKDFVDKTNYDTYISVVYHWVDDLKLENICHTKQVLWPACSSKTWGFPKSDWGLSFIIMSNYTKFEESKTVISATISINEKSKNNNKTPNECSEKELLDEIFNQLKTNFKSLPKPDKVVFNGSYKKDGIWYSKDTAFISTEHGYIDFKMDYDNLYNCGTHNGYSTFNFTSMESSVQNAMILLNKLEKMEFTNHNILTLRKVVLLICLLIVLYLIKIKKYY